jgi:acyl carrier protein
MYEVKPRDPRLPASDFEEVTPTRQQVREFLATLVHEVCDIDRSLITDAARIDAELALESVQMVQIQVALEQEYDTTLDFLEILRLNSFGRIADYIHLQAMRSGE